MDEAKKKEAAQGGERVSLPSFGTEGMGAALESLLLDLLRAGAPPEFAIECARLLPTMVQLKAKRDQEAAKQAAAAKRSNSGRIHG
jgi:hypothetical protein